jgi:hypothetical protein
MIFAAIQNVLDVSNPFEASKFGKDIGFRAAQL